MAEPRASTEKTDPLTHTQVCQHTTATTLEDLGFIPRDATAEEIAEFPHGTDKTPKIAWVVMFIGAAERFAHYAIISPWQNYMQNPRGMVAAPGALGLGQSTATKIYNAFFFFSYLTPLPFAIICDGWLGRYKTLVISFGFYMVGCVLLFTTSLPEALDAGVGLGGLLGSMIFIGLGVGGVKAAFFPFLGDQYIQKKPQLARRKNGDFVIVDSTRTVQLLYNAFYWFTNIASLSSIATTFLEREYDFWVSYLMGASSLAIAAATLICFNSRMNKVASQGNILPKATQTILCVIKSGMKFANAKPGYQAAHYGRTVPWTDKFVDEMKRGVLACRVIFSFLLFYACITQMYNNLISQAGQMELHGVPNDMIQGLAGVACVLFGPIIQWLYSFLARKKIQFGPMARITTAFIFCGGAMAYATGVQKLIYISGPCYERPLACPESLNGSIPNRVNVWVQLPVYFIIAVAEIFGFVTAFEYAYNKAPKDMKTVVQALTQLTACMASVIGIALGLVSRDPHLVIFYACLAGSMGLCTVVFYVLFRKYDKIDRQLDQLDLDEAREQHDA